MYYECLEPFLYRRWFLQVSFEDTMTCGMKIEFWSIFFHAFLKCHNLNLSSPIPLTMSSQKLLTLVVKFNSQKCIILLSSWVVFNCLDFKFNLLQWDSSIWSLYSQIYCQAHKHSSSTKGLMHIPIKTLVSVCNQISYIVPTLPSWEN